MLFNPKKEANFLEKFVSALHHIPIVSNNVINSTDYFGFSRRSGADVDMV